MQRIMLYGFSFWCDTLGVMRDPKKYKPIFVKNKAHSDLDWLKKKTGKAKTVIVEELAAAARAGMERQGCK